MSQLTADFKQTGNSFINMKAGELQKLWLIFNLNLNVIVTAGEQY